MSRSISRLLPVVLAAASLVFVGGASAETINKCNAAKRKCVAKLAAGLLGCHAKAVASGDAVDPQCVAKAHAKFDGGTSPTDGCFEKLETKLGAACLTQDDQATVAPRVDAFVADVVAALEPTYPAIVTSPCTAGKLKCVAQTNSALLGCQAKAALKGTLDPACVLKARRKLDGTLLDPPDPSMGCFEKLEAKAKACLTADDTAALAQRVATAVATTQCSLDPLDPACACPTRMEFTPDAGDPASRADLGWTGFGHRQKLVSDAAIALVVSGCTNGAAPCGTCDLSGPIEPPNGDSRRCTGDPFVRCTNDAQCTGIGACAFFLGAPFPTSGGGIGNCIVRHVSGGVTGTLDPDTGDVSISVPTTTRVYLGGSPDAPCPRCIAGTCQGGQRALLPCAIDGSSPTPNFGDLSLDCPPQTAQLIATATTTIPSSTGSPALTLTSAQPFCRSLDATAQKCFCSTCNSGGTTLCTSNADCPDPAGPIGPVCGGLRCFGGSNGGAACTQNTQCPGGACTVPGAAPTKPNSCNPGGCLSDVCLNGPLDPVCHPTGHYLPCTQDADCSAFPGDTCSGLSPRACFPDNGQLGGQVTGHGAPSPTEPTLASVFCMPPSQNSASDFVFGYPGPGRFEQRGAMTISAPPARRVFATSTVQSGALGGLAGADAICQARADAAALGGTFKAWLSDASQNPATRLTRAFADYALVTGTVIAHGWGDLLDGALEHAIDADETGAALSSPRGAWTNTTISGGFGGQSCNDWTTGTVGTNGVWGAVDATDATWTNEVASTDCSRTLHLYCFEQ